MLLETSYAEIVIRLAENARDKGYPHLVVELLPTEIRLQPDQVNSFATIDDALIIWMRKWIIGTCRVAVLNIPFMISTLMNF